MNENTKNRTAAEIVAALKRHEIDDATITTTAAASVRWSNYGVPDVVEEFERGEVLDLQDWRPEGVIIRADGHDEVFASWRDLERLTAEEPKSAAAVSASDVITAAVERFAKYREASYKADAAAHEASRKHHQQWRESGRGNKERYEAMMEAHRAKESAALACTFAREIVREMLAAEAVKAYADIIGGFVGKCAGPKTCHKLYTEISGRLEARGFRGVRVWFGSLGYGRKHSNIEISAEGLNGSENVTIYGKYGENGGGNEFTDDENRFNGRELCGREFPSDERTPEQFAADFIAAEEEIEDLRKEYEAKRDAIAKRVEIGAARPRSWHTVEDSRNA